MFLCFIGWCLFEMLRLSINDVLFLIRVAIIRLLFDWNYEAILATKYRYAGFTADPSFEAKVSSWIILLIFSKMVFHYYEDSERLSSKVYLLLFLLSTVPFTTMVAYGACTIAFILANCIYYLVLFLSYNTLNSVGVSRIEMSTKMRKIQGGDAMIKGITLFFVLILVYISGRYTHFRFNFNLYNVYELRGEAATYNLPRLLTYAFSWSRALIPLCIAIFLKKKDGLMVAVCILAELLSFGIDGSKSPLFLSICVLIVFLLPKRALKKLNTYILTGLTIILGASILQYVVTDNFSLCALITRRTFFVPLRLENCYFDFFKDKVPDFFRGSFLRHFGFQTPYPNLDNIIGDVYFHAPGMNCNNGLLSDAISNLGYVGIFIMPLMIALTLIVLDRCSAGLDQRIYCVLSISIANVLLNTFLLTALLTHGILVLMLLLAMIERNEENKAESFFAEEGHLEKSTQ